MDGYKSVRRPGGATERKHVSQRSETEKAAAVLGLEEQNKNMIPQSPKCALPTLLPPSRKPELRVLRSLVAPGAGSHWPWQ